MSSLTAMVVSMSVGGLGLLAMGVRMFFAFREIDAAEFHKGLHGEAVDITTLKGRNSTFIREVIRLECERVAEKERARRAALIHFFHPLTPVSWFCGDRSSGGHGELDVDNLTCPDCINRQPLYDAICSAQMRKLGRA